MAPTYSKWKDKVALVTGGSSGIGLEVARLLAKGGANVWLLARHQEELEKAVEQLPCDQAYACNVIVADVSNESQVFSAIEQITKQAGLPELVVNSAGITYPSKFMDIDLDTFRRLMDVNYFGTVYVTRAVLPGMLERGSGHIVNISSMAGFIGIFGYTAYGASKFAVRGFSDALRSELKPTGIQISIVFPLDTDTPQLEYENQFKPYESKALASMGGVMSPKTVAKVILTQAARGRYVILPGWESKFWYYLIGLAGNLTYPVLDFLIKRAQQNADHSS